MISNIFRKKYLLWEKQEKSNRSEEGITQI